MKKKPRGLVARCIARVKRIRPDKSLRDVAAICRSLARKRRKVAKKNAKKGRGRRSR